MGLRNKYCRTFPSPFRLHNSSPAAHLHHFSKSQSRYDLGQRVRQVGSAPFPRYALISIVTVDLTNLSPAIFLVPFIHLVFGFETAIRSVSSTPFARRKKWVTLLCLAVNAFLLICTWLVTVLKPNRKKCLGDVIWRSINYSTLAIGLFATTMFMFSIMATVIAVRLRTTVNIDPYERIAATRMVYYLILTVIIEVRREPSHTRSCSIY